MKPLLAASVVVFVVALAGCANQKAPAEAAIKTAQDSFNAVSVDAQKYVPDQARAIQDALTSAQTAATNGDYAAALTQAQALPAQISALGPAIAARKTALSAEWTSLSASVPAMLDALKTRVATLTKTRRLPTGVTKDAVDNAEAGLANATQSWAEAAAASASGDLATAMEKASAVKTKLTDLMASINMPMPAGTM
jgi:hypothetical protein